PRRHDIEHSELLDSLRMIQRQAIGDAPAAVMPRDGEALEAEMAHEGDLVPRHGPFGIWLVVRRRRRLAAAAIAAQIRRDHGEIPRQPRRDLVPHDMGLGMAMEQQQRRPGAAMTQADLDLAGLDGGEGEAFEHGRVLSRKVLPQRHRGTEIASQRASAAARLASMILLSSVRLCVSVPLWSTFLLEWLAGSTS